MSTEAPHHGHAAAAGKPTTGRNTAETIAAPIEINTVVASGSSPRLMVAFHPAWHAAANSTAAKTNGAIARTIPGARGRPPITVSPSAVRRVPSIPERRPRAHLRRGALILFGASDLGAEDMSRPPTPMGVVEHGARERHHIGLALGDDRLGLLGRGDQTDRARRNAGLAFDLFGELHIGIGDQGGPRVGADAARGNADEIEPRRLQRLGKTGRIVGRQSALDPIVAGDPRA